MRIKPTERQEIASIIHDEMEEASRRITERLSQLQVRSAAAANEDDGGVRRFYEELVDKDWTAADEATLKSLEKLSETQIREIIREGFRRSRVHPIPSLAYLVNLTRRDEEFPPVDTEPLKNPDAVSAAERERLANLLYRELGDAAHEIASRLQLTDPKAEVVRERLQIAEGNIIGGFTPLV